MTTPSFDAALLDRLMEEAGIDLLLATSKDNVQHLLGGHRSLFFEVMDATGLSRYLPALVYPKARPTKRLSLSTGWIAFSGRGDRSRVRDPRRRRPWLESQRDY
jgi:hypothetical protein